MRRSTQSTFITNFLKTIHFCDKNKSARPKKKNKKRGSNKCKQLVLRAHIKPKNQKKGKGTNYAIYHSTFTLKFDCFEIN